MTIYYVLLILVQFIIFWIFLYFRFIYHKHDYVFLKEIKVYGSIKTRQQALPIEIIRCYECSTCKNIKKIKI